MVISLKERFRFRTINILLFVGLITSISNGLFNTIWALYLDGFLHSESSVGLFSTLISFVALVAFIILVHVIEKYQEEKVYFYSLLISIFILFLYAVVNSFTIVIIISLAYIILAVLRAESFGIIFRNESQTRNLGKNEGLIYTLSNIGLILGPLTAALLLKIYNVNRLFIIISLVALVSLFIFSFYKHKSRKYKLNYNLFTGIKYFFKNPDLRNLYISGIGVSIWWGFVFIYVPLHMVRNGLDKSQVGIFFFLAMIPLLFEYFVGKKSDKVGIKSFIVSGYFIISIFALIAFIMNNIYLVLLAIILASFGSAFIDPTRETGFFKLISKKEQERYYGIFLTNVEVGLLLGKFIPALLLIFLPFSYIFILLSFIMFISGLISLNLKNI